jgi:two-component system, OmpR family, phosphate regulon response regulator PhoB
MIGTDDLMPDAPRDRVLVVDDEPDLRQLVTINLREAGFDVDAVGSGQAGLALATKTKPAVIVLDLMLPDVPGTEVCRQLRADVVLADSAVLMLTARGDEHDRLLGFEVGADDYVVKPFSVRELVMRVRALARRTAERRSARETSAGKGGEKRLRWKGLELDPSRHRVTVDDVELSLRPLEFKLIQILLENPGRVLSRAQLLEDVWGVSGDASSRTVDTHVRRLRERLGAYGDAVETVHGFGYRLREVGGAGGVAG